MSSICGSFYLVKADNIVVHTLPARRFKSHPTWRGFHLSLSIFSLLMGTKFTAKQKFIYFLCLNFKNKQNCNFCYHSLPNYWESMPSAEQWERQLLCNCVQFWCLVFCCCCNSKFLHWCLIIQNYDNAIWVKYGGHEPETQESYC